MSGGAGLNTRLRSAISYQPRLGESKCVRCGPILRASVSRPPVETLAQPVSGGRGGPQSSFKPMYVCMSTYAAQPGGLPDCRYSKNRRADEGARMQHNAPRCRLAYGCGAVRMLCSVCSGMASGGLCTVHALHAQGHHRCSHGPPLVPPRAHGTRAWPAGPMTRPARHWSPWPGKTRNYHPRPAPPRAGWRRAAGCSALGTRPDHSSAHGDSLAQGEIEGEAAAAILGARRYSIRVAGPPPSQHGSQATPACTTERDGARKSYAAWLTLRPSRPLPDGPWVGRGVGSYKDIVRPTPLSPSPSVLGSFHSLADFPFVLQLGPHTYVPCCHRRRRSFLRSTQSRTTTTYPSIYPARHSTLSSALGHLGSPPTSSPRVRLIRQPVHQFMSRMPALLLPDTAAPYAPRSTCTVVLNTTVDPWLTATLKRVNRVKRPLNSVPQHTKCLTETLSQASSVWNLCTLMVPRAPAAHLDQHDNALVDALLRFELLQVQAYVVHVDFVLANEVAFKLTKDSIQELVDYHKEVFLIDQSDSTWQWTEKEAHIQKLHDEFVGQANKFVYRTKATALEGLDEDGAGELLCGRSEEVKTLVLNLFLPLLPPPPRFVEPAAPLYAGGVAAHWWVPTQPAPPACAPPPVEAWKILPSSPVDDAPGRSMPASSGGGYPSSSSSSGGYPSSSSGAYPSAVWGALSLPAASYATAPPTTLDAYSAAPSLSASYADVGPYCSAPAPQYSHASPMLPPLPLPLPSLVAHQCSAATSAGPGFGFGWDRYPEYTTTM